MYLSYKFDLLLEIQIAFTTIGLLANLMMSFSILIHINWVSKFVGICEKIKNLKYNVLLKKHGNILQFTPIILSTYSDQLVYFYFLIIISFIIAILLYISYNKINNLIYFNITLFIINLSYIYIFIRFNINLLILMFILTVISLIINNKLNNIYKNLIQNYLLINITIFSLFSIIINFYTRIFRILLIEKIKLNDLFFLFIYGIKFYLMIFIFCLIIFLIIKKFILFFQEPLHLINDSIYHKNIIINYFYERSYYFKLFLKKLYKINLLLFGQDFYILNNLEEIKFLSQKRGIINPNIIFWGPILILICSFAFDIYFNSGFIFSLIIIIPFYFIFFFLCFLNFSFINFIQNSTSLIFIEGDGENENEIEKKNGGVFSDFGRWQSLPQDQTITKPRQININSQGISYKGPEKIVRTINSSALRHYKGIGYFTALFSCTMIGCTYAIKSDSSLIENIQNRINSDYTKLQRDSGFSLEELKKPDNPFNSEYRQIKRSDDLFQKNNNQVIYKRIISNTKEVYSGNFYKNK